MISLETERLYLRDVREEDAERIAAIWVDPDNTEYMGGPRDPETVKASVREDAKRLKRVDLWPVFLRSGELIGTCGFVEKEVDGTWENELVYVIDKAHRGQGYAPEIGAALIDYARKVLVLERVVALIDPANAASARVAEKLGFRFEKNSVRPGGRTLKVYARRTWR